MTARSDAHMRLIVLRPQPGADTTAARARAAGLDPVVVPLFAVEPCAWIPPDDALDAIVFTSANAVRHAGGGLVAHATVPVWAVGAATADAARVAGLTVAHIGAGDADALAAALVAAGLRRVLWLCGEDRRPFAAPGVDIAARVVYASRTVTAPAGLTDAIARPAAAMLHSARAARRLAELVDDRGGTALIAISARAAVAAGPGWRAVRVAARPSDDAMLELARSMCQKPRGDLAGDTV